MNEDRNAFWAEEVNKLSPLGQYLAHIDIDKRVTVALDTGREVSGYVVEHDHPHVLALRYATSISYVDVTRVVALTVCKE